MKRYFSSFYGLLCFLVQPEDSSMGEEIPGAYRRQTGRRFDPAGIVKALFWMVMAVAAGMMIAQL